MKKQSDNLTTDEALYLQAKAMYYKGEPIMTDEEFDILEDVLRSLDSFVLDIVGAGSKSKKGVVEHVSVMGSLAKIQFKPNYIPHTEFINWLNQIPVNTEVHVTFDPKLDGNAINITYIDGKLTTIASRGDGKKGQDYTKKLGNHFPKFLKGFTGEIRGEAVIDQFLFEDKYVNNIQPGDKVYKNPRNWVAGRLNTDNSDYTDIDVVCFEIVDFKGNSKKQLINWGFNVQDFGLTYNAKELINLDTFTKVYEQFVAYRKTSKYQLDGFVAKMDESIREKIGRNDHHPFWAIALKFETKAVVTKIIDIVWTLSKRGELCPVAILEPVELLGSTVTKASVYNASWMLAKNAYPGATVLLIKSGDIIPRIIEIIEPSTIAYSLPTEWNGKNVSYNDVQLILEGFEDTEEYKAAMLHNAIVALGIEGIGPATCERINKTGLTLSKMLYESPDGLRMLLLQSGEFKQGRELEILIENVFSLTKVELWQVVYAMQFKNCGKTISKQLANWLVKIPYDFKGLEKAVVEEFINSKIAQDSVKELVGILIDTNVTVIRPEPPKAGLITYCMTGDCTTHPTKKDFARDVEASGKCKEESLTKTTSYLVTNSKASMTTKMQKAEKNGTKIVTYDEFLVIMEKA